MNKNSVKKSREIIQQKNNCFTPEERIQRFLESVELFYSKVETEWLSILLKRGCRLADDERKCWILEKGFDPYEVKMKVIIKDNKRILLKPIGTMSQGIYGRVDLIYEAKSEMFVLIGKGIVSPRQLLERIDMENSGKIPFPSIDELEWKYASKYPDLKYETLDSDVFFNTIKRVIHG